MQIISCPICGTELELPDNLPEGQHLQCPDCNKKFVVHAGIATQVYVKSARIIKEGFSASNNVPGLTLAAFIIFYALFGVSVFGNLADLPESITGVIAAIGCIAFTLCAHFGKNWARITLTSLLGLALLCMLLLNYVLAVIAILILATPIVFLWLPCSNRWYRAKKAAKLQPPRL